ncbi:1,4-alpha-glucan branching protein GlgB [Candidatus Thiosymbion oneisti]|uniref:1,4-alpha-glucan branching protein GlgB n=1 Tax=Candidatus Thiosymbion oneisti TaxID=589554 RepID=UPI000AF5DCF5|nr:1,4-alpha-glucan branching protein GlgB [Candidatus Thiosymbion oneisti]
MPTGTSDRAQPSDAIARILEARYQDPFQVLGRHLAGDRCLVWAFLPGAETVRIPEAPVELTRLPGTDLFVWEGSPGAVPARYRLNWEDRAGNRYSRYDPYCFPPQLPDLELRLFSAGRHWHAHRFLGAHLCTPDGIPGVRFAVWAPNGERVSVVGDFNHWDGRAHPMRLRGDSGVWELFIPGLGAGDLYKFELRDRQGSIQIKIDPYARSFQQRPRTAAYICGASRFRWQDQAWMQARARSDWQHLPLSIYEVHLGSWRRGPKGQFLTYRALAEQLADYALALGVTHIELLPMTEHPLDASWGYQATGYFAPTSRFGTPDDFRWFVDHLHRRGIGVILDWVPAHFPRDTFALARYDGSALYEYEDPRRGEHQDWGTLIFDYGRNQIRNFLISSALYWLDEFHLDGLRVDAVASMLYLDYSRQPGEWLPNRHGGNENLEAVELLRRLNVVTHERHPGILMIAEESTAWPAVSRPTHLGGLGFGMKWNLGWMHDTLAYLAQDPIYRHRHQERLTFGLHYAFSENFILPFSHDEVVHGKGSLLDRMPGDARQKFASLRLLYSLMFTYPGKKLLFMGCEFGQTKEWDAAGALDWQLTEHPRHQGIRRLVADLNRLYRSHQALHDLDFCAAGFEWIDCHDSAQSVISYLRKDRGGKQLLAAVFNFTPLPRRDYRLGVPRPGFYREAINSDAEIYGGSNLGNRDGVASQPLNCMGWPHSIPLVLPPLGAVILIHEPLSD